MWNLQTGAALNTFTGHEAEKQLEAAQAWGAASGAGPTARVKCERDDMLELEGPTGGGHMGKVFITPPYNAATRTIRLGAASKRVAFFTPGNKFLIYEVQL